MNNCHTPLHVVVYVQTVHIDWLKLDQSKNYDYLLDYIVVGDRFYLSN